jgi:16S rRNA (cytosine967-C5)-methyltransferase
MTPAARLQAAIEILCGLEKTGQPADRFLREWFRARRYAGSKDRAAVAERIYDVLRRRASFSWRMGDTARGRVIASLLAEGQTPEAIESLFSGEDYAPARLPDEERARLRTPPQTEAEPHIRGEYPQWLEPELTRAFGDTLAGEMHAMLARAPVDLRVNRLRATREAMLVGLKALGIACGPTRFSPDGIRVPSAAGLGTLQHTQFFETGAFEIQDEGSQIAALLCGAKPGDLVLDLAAGGGGKSLALAAAMRNEGSILAYDADETRLKEVRPRARRAGADIIVASNKKGGPVWGNGRFGIVLVDAPCSGSGTWRRSPEQKWRLTPERLAQLRRVQGEMLDDGARHVGPGGRLVYVTCSLLPSENEDAIDGFLNRNRDFRIVPAAQIWSETITGEPPPDLGQFFRASPWKCGTDGFFVCIMSRI